MGVLTKAQEFNEVVKLNGYKIGDDYADVFAKMFK